jgi:hypothetical protein
MDYIMRRTTRRPIFIHEFEQAKLEIFAALNHMTSQIKDYDRVGPRLGKEFLIEDATRIRKINSRRTMGHAFKILRKKIEALPHDAADMSERGDQYLFDLLREGRLTPNLDSLTEEQTSNLIGADISKMPGWNTFRRELEGGPVGRTPAEYTIYPFYRALLNSMALAAVEALAADPAEIGGDERQQKTNIAVDRHVTLLKKSLGPVLSGLG